MANDVKIRFRSFLPGSGVDSGGNNKQGKTNVRGRIEVTSYSRGGESLTPADVGLTRIDDLTLTLEEPISGSDPAESRRSVGYSRSAQEFYINTGGPTEGELAAGTAVNLSFDAFGDSAHDIELL